MGRRVASGHDARRPRPALWLARAALVGASLLPGGCVTTGPMDWIHNGFKVGPNYRRPPAPVAPEWIESNDPRTRGAPPRDGDWWEVFRDPVLDSLVCRAYRQNPNLRSVGTRVLQARAQQAIAVGNVLPQTQQVLGVYSYGRVADNPSHINLTAFNLSWELDFWGRYRRQVESANASLDASMEDYDAALVTLLADVATNYVQYRIAQQRVRIARDNLRAQEEVLAVAERQQKAGTVTGLDVDQLRTLVEQTRSAIPALQTVQGQANDRLCVLLGEPPHDLEPDLGPAPEPGAAPTPNVPADVAAGVPAELLRRRPDVRAAERRIAAQSAQIGVAEADLYPSISVGTIFGDVNAKLGPGLKPNGFLWFITPQFTWNVLNYGRLANNVHLQDARTQELVASYQNTVLTAAQEVQTALRGFLRSQEQADALTRSAAAAVSATKTEERLFSDVKADINRLFTLENARLQAQDQLAAARGNVALNLINVYRALGGGWEVRVQNYCCRPRISLVEPDAAPAGPPEQLPPPGVPAPTGAWATERE